MGDMTDKIMAIVAPLTMIGFLAVVAAFVAGTGPHPGDRAGVRDGDLRLLAVLSQQTQLT